LVDSLVSAGQERSWFSGLSGADTLGQKARKNRLLFLGGTTMNPVQEVYTAAQRWLKDAELQLQNEERAYIRRHEIKTRDGSMPALLEDLDDPRRAVNFMGDFYNCVASPEMLDALSRSREALKVAENSLITWGLTERRSFTQQVTILLASALARQNQRSAPAEAKG
jgi:hypothetical protein